MPDLIVVLGETEVSLGTRRRRIRDRHGRGARGPGVMPRQPGVPELPTDRERFDAIVLAVAEAVERRCAHRLGLIEYAVEEAPLVPDDWGTDQVPLASLVRGSGTRATRLVLFRRPIQHRAPTRDECEQLVRVVITEQLADLLGVPAEEIDPDY